MIIVHSDETSRVTRSVLSGMLFNDCSLVAKSVVSLMKEGRVSICGCRWQSTNGRSFQLVLHMTIKLDAQGSLDCRSWVASKILLSSHGMMLGSPWSLGLWHSKFSLLPATLLFLQHIQWWGLCPVRGGAFHSSAVSWPRQHSPHGT